MASEYAVTCALPYSLDRAAAFNVSVFVAPTIEADSQSKLGNWALFPDWGSAASEIRVELSDNRGVIECAAILAPIDSDFWKAVFPETLAVHSPGVPDWSKREWASFSARRVHDIALAMHVATILSSPSNPPAPTDHPLSREIYGLAVQMGCYPDRGRSLDLRGYDESRATAELDALLRRAGSLAGIDQAIAREEGSLRGLALELHRCRRFYERPEAQWPHRPDPIPRAKPPPLPDNEPEFHSRCAFLGDQPELMRRLGLVIDLVADPARLRGAQWLSAELYLANGEHVSRSTRTRCQSGESLFTTKPRTPDWSDGALRLGDEDRFSVLTLDTDGSALKADRFLWTLPRLMSVQQNGDPVDAATPAQRSPGFTVAATKQGLRIQSDVSRQGSVFRDLKRGRVPVLDTEDVMRGLRVEVWDDQVRKWHSLHERLGRVVVHGYQPVVEDEQPGFIQGTAAHENFRSPQAPVQVHDALFGWEGWSLSAPRPGKRVWEKDGKEELLDEDGVVDVDHPYQVTNKVKPGTLPRLRYGRSYSFRAWGVDLAGNSRPHDLNIPDAGPVDLPRRPAAGSGSADPFGARLIAGARSTTSSRSAVVASEADASGIEPEIMSYLRTRRLESASASRLREGGSRSARLVSAISQELATADLANWSPTSIQVSRAQLSAAVGSHLGSFIPGARPEPNAVTKALDTMTAPRPFLRWEPVPSPAVVARWRFTEGESLRTLVIRSGVTQDPETLAITIEEPAQFVAMATARVPDCGYRTTAERHLASPKITQFQAELHGMFDVGIGPATAIERRRALAWALRADGTFADRERADIDNPPAKVAQPGMGIVYSGQPTTNLKALKSLPGEPRPPKNRPVIGPGDPPAPGQTIVHDVDELALPYLPDPMARGVAIHFPEAETWGLTFPFDGEGFTVSYGGQWPEVEPFRLILGAGSSLNAAVDGRAIAVKLPQGDVQQLRVSSALPGDKLDLLGPWHALPKPVRSNADVREAAADGLLWGLSPFEQVTLIHAVNRPIEAPRPVRIIPIRGVGATHATLAGAIDLHGPSTGVLAVEAVWDEPVDDPTLPVSFRRKSGAKAFETIVLPREDIALLGDKDQPLTLPDIGPVQIHQAIHEFHDTRHRDIDYTFRAFTRFREFFHPDLFKNPQGNPTDDMQSVVGPVLRLSIPSSARPAPPIVHSVLPMFRWSDETEPEQPMARRRTRRAGIRIYLERPWFTSGDGELLGIVIATGGDDGHYPDVEDQSGFPFVSKWGADPIWEALDVERRALPMLGLDDLLRLMMLDDRSEPARPVLPPRDLPLAALAGQPIVTVLGYTPQFNEDRKLWFVDVAVDPGAHFWPFLKLTVCRYQPDSIPTCHLSAPVQCDFVQLPPERTASVSRTDDRHVRVVVSGAVGWRGAPAAARGNLRDQITHNRRLVARLQRKDPEIKSDLGWTTIAVAELALRGLSADGHNATWVTELDAGEVIAFQTPETGDSEWRVATEEWELIEADDLVINVAGRDRHLPHAEPRLVYADHIAL